MNISPGWTTQPQWAFGVPTGGGGQQGCPDPTGGHTGSNVYGYNLNGAYEPSMTEKYLTTPALNLTGFTSTRLAFWRWLGVEDPTWDHAKVQVSVNGTSWTTVWENTGTIADGAWVYQEINIASIADNHAAVYIRWVMGPSDSLYQYCGWNIDDVQITGIAPVGMGDLNCDGVLNMSDIGPFALALIDPAGYAVSYPECTQFLADINEDGQRDGRDIQEFVTALLGG